MAHGDVEREWRTRSRERGANHLRVPVLFSASLYTLKHHIGLVRQRLDRGESVRTRAAS